MTGLVSVPLVTLQHECEDEVFKSSGSSNNGGTLFDYYLTDQLNHGVGKAR